MVELDYGRLEEILDTKTNLSRVEVARVMIMTESMAERLDHLEPEEFLYMMLADSNVGDENVETVVEAY